MHGLKGISSKPMLGGLRLEVLQEQVDFSGTELLGKRHKYVRVPQVAIVLKDLVFKNEVIPERVPGQI